jgi:hypothetical protein
MEWGYRPKKIGSANQANMNSFLLSAASESVEEAEMFRGKDQSMLRVIPIEPLWVGW